MIKNSRNGLKIFVLIGFFLMAISPPAISQEDIPSKDQFIVNPHWTEKDAPEKDRKLRMHRAEKNVEKTMQELDQNIKTLCSEKKSVFRLKGNESSIKLTTFKNYNVPVPARFTRFDGYIVWEGGNFPPKSTLIIDTGSFNSDNLWRDSRVKRYLLKANKRKFATANLDMRYYGIEKRSAGIKKIVGSIQFRGENYSIQTKNNVWKKDDDWVIQSQETLRFKPDIPEKNWMGIMKRCVHKSLSKAVDVEWKLVFKPVCG